MIECMLPKRGAKGPGVKGRLRRNLVPIWVPGLRGGGAQTVLLVVMLDLPPVVYGVSTVARSVRRGVRSCLVLHALGCTRKPVGDCMVLIVRFPPPECRLACPAGIGRIADSDFVNKGGCAGLVSLPVGVRSQLRRVDHRSTSLRICDGHSSV